VFTSLKLRAFCETNRFFVFEGPAKAEEENKDANKDKDAGKADAGKADVKKDTKA